MSTVRANTISNVAGTSSRATQDVISGSARAWADWVGSSGAINASFNVSSITRTATGDYTINFTNALPSANYVVVAGSTSSTLTNSNVQTLLANTGKTTTSLRVQTGPPNTGAIADIQAAAIAVFGG